MKKIIVMSICAWWLTISMGGENAPIKDIGPFATAEDCRNAEIQVQPPEPKRPCNKKDGCPPTIVQVAQLLIRCHERN